MIKLTAQQQEVLEHLLRGQSNRIISYEMGLQESTVKVHVRNLMRLYKATNRTEIVAWHYLRLLRKLDPHLDAIVCYASTAGEYEPNRIVADIRELLK